MTTLPTGATLGMIAELHVHSVLLEQRHYPTCYAYPSRTPAKEYERELRKPLAVSTVQALTRYHGSSCALCTHTPQHVNSHIDG